ncbi:MAG: DUF4942 domain-containing protein [Sulfuritalea sp.]|nr:DUF4942 domain-containing protein [Sulfuritalea sp.]
MDAQFYPTPPDLAARAWGKFKNREFTRVLEPSAGDGALADANPRERDYYRRNIPIDCCELDISKHPMLRAKDYDVVGVDFMQFSSGSIYSHVILNPPFANGAAHVLKAWDLVWDAEIVAIINAETVRNRCSKERQMLGNLIDQFGEVEFIADAFMVPDAERKTAVEVALVYLRKEANVAVDIVGDLLSDLNDDAETGAGLAGGYEEVHALALPNSFVENTVRAFKAAVRTMREAVFGEARAHYYATLLGDTMAVRNGDGGASKPDTSVKWVQGEIAKRYSLLKDRAWAGILRSTNVTSRLSSSAQQRVEKEFADIKKLEFTVPNIYGFLCGLVENRAAMQLEMACDVFDLITRYHSDNTVFYKGWKSNDRHRTAGMKIKTTRFVLPGHGTHSYQHGLNYESTRLLADFDKVFAMLDGKIEPEVSLVQTFSAHFADLKHGARVSSSYFDVRYYPGAGTIHFFSTNRKLVDRLNRLVGRHRQWLPPEGAKVSDAFWLSFDSAEKLDKELRTEINNAAGRSYWDHPLHNICSGDEDRKARAMEAIDDAATVVLERHGINVDFQIDAQQPEQLRLAA